MDIIVLINVVVIVLQKVSVIGLQVIVMEVVSQDGWDKCVIKVYLFINKRKLYVLIFDFVRLEYR